jgi:hypothetical protein
MTDVEAQIAAPWKQNETRSKRRPGMRWNWRNQN